MSSHDESKEGLLKPTEKPTYGRPSVDSIDSSVLDYLDERSEVAETENLPQKWVQRQSMWRSSCCRITLGVVALLALIILGGGFLGYRYTGPKDGHSPPWYPSPRGGTVKSWEESYRKAAEMVSKMTLPEKVNVTTGTGWSMGPGVGNTGPALTAGFPSLVLQDGPLGIRLADNITAFPAGVTVGATFNRELMYERGKAHGIEARNKGINVILGPAVGALGRAPAGGRNWEGFGADPYLQGIACSETIRGIQEQNVIATIKHFVANEQEHFRQPWEWGLPHAISSNVDDRTMHEVYAWPFADAVKAGVASVMCSYNQVNNSYACGNSKLLNGILKDEMGFQGFVQSDWLAQRSGVASALAGLDMTMPGDGLRWQNGDSLWGPKLSQAILNGSLPLDRLNDMVTRVVAAWYQLGQDDEELFDRNGPNFSSFTDERYGVAAPGSPTKQDKVEVNKFVDVQEDHYEIARKVAVEGTVLLKNEGNLLPLSREGKSGAVPETATKDRKLRVGVFGEDAGPGDGPNACDDRGCNQGTLGSGWGSGAVEFPYLVTPASALREGFSKDHVEVSEFLENNVKKLTKSVSLAEQDICFVFASSDAGEGFIKWDKVAGDRNDLNLQKGGDELVQHVADNCGGDTVVVVHAVGPVTIEEWIDHPRIKTVFAAHLPGQESGNAIASLIFGDENPSGRLPYTVGKNLKDYGNGGQILYHPNGVVPQQTFSEGLYIDYRHFDKENITPRFAFGYGLSYSSFSFSDIRLEEQKPKSALPAARPSAEIEPPTYDNTIPDPEEALFPEEIRRLKKYIYPYIDSVKDIKSGDYPYPEGYDVERLPSQAGGAEGGNPSLWETHLRVTIMIENTGPRGGSTVPQLYLSYPDGTATDFPKRVLRGFQKVYLEEGEKREVEFELTRRDLSYWDVERQNWVMLEEGQYGVLIGYDERDLALEAKW